MPICGDCNFSRVKKTGELCAHCQERRRRLFHPDELRLERVRAYYGVLNHEPAFATALRALADELAPFVTDVGSPPVKARPALEAFMKRWALPRPDGLLDVWYALRGARFRRWPLRLRLAWRMLSSPPYPTFSNEPSKEPSPETAAQVMALVEKDAGWRPLPPRDHDRTLVEARGRRLFRRLALGWNWDRIQETERKETGIFVDQESMRDTVGEWAKLLGIPQRRGRPPKSG